MSGSVRDSEVASINLQYNLDATEFIPSWLKKKPPTAAAPVSVVEESPKASPPRASTSSVQSRLSPNAREFTPNQQQQQIRHLSAEAPEFTPSRSKSGSPQGAPTAALESTSLQYNPINGTLESVKEAVERKTEQEIFAISSRSAFSLNAVAFLPAYFKRAKQGKPGVSPLLQPRPTPQGPLLLQESWSFYYLDRAACQANDFDPILVYRFDNVEDFWRLLNNVPEANDMPVGSTYFLFRSDIGPKWEDPANRDGGSWEIRLKYSEPVQEAWLRLCCCTIGESWTAQYQFCVTGIVLKCREHHHAVQIWLKSEQPMFPTELTNHLGQAIPAFTSQFVKHNVVLELTKKEPSSTRKKKRKD